MFERGAFGRRAFVLSGEDRGVERFGADIVEVDVCAFRRLLERGGQGAGGLVVDRDVDLDIGRGGKVG